MAECRFTPLGKRQPPGGAVERVGAAVGQLQEILLAAAAEGKVSDSPPDDQPDAVPRALRATIGVLVALGGVLIALGGLAASARAQGASKPAEKARQLSKQAS